MVGWRSGLILRITRSNPRSTGFLDSHGLAEQASTSYSREVDCHLNTSFSLYIERRKGYWAAHLYKVCQYKKCCYCYTTVLRCFKHYFLFSWVVSGKYPFELIVVQDRIHVAGLQLSRTVWAQVQHEGSDKSQGLEEVNPKQMAAYRQNSVIFTWPILSAKKRSPNHHSPGGVS